MTNKPYVKKYDGNGILINPITKDKPYLHVTRTTSSQKEDFKYVIIRNAATGEFVGRVKRGGNNRKVAANTQRRKPSMKSRQIKFAN